MSEKVEAKVEGKPVEATVESKTEAKVENGKVVYESKSNGGLCATIRKGLIKLGCVIRDHPIMTALLVGGAGVSVYGAKKAYETGVKDGYREGERDALQQQNEQKLITEAESEEEEEVVEPEEISVNEEVG